MKIDKINQKYNMLFEKYGDSEEAVGWSKNKQRLRFEILVSLFGLEEKTSVLDFGCGLGHLKTFLKMKNVKGNYLGVDINENFVKHCQKKFPEADFLCEDILKKQIDKRFDYAFSSGVHNIKVDDNYKFLDETVACFDKVCEKGYSLNFLSDKVDFLTKDSFHFDPLKVLKIFYKYGNRVVLRNDYMPFEFTVFAWKNTSFDKEKVVFNEYLSLC